MGYAIPSGNTSEPLLFLMVLAADHITPATGKSPTVTISKAGATFATPIGAITEVGNGWYKVAANLTDADTIGPLLLHATATSSDPTDEQYDVVDYDPTSYAINAAVSITPTQKTASDLCTAALQRLGLIEAGQAASSEDLLLALDRLNDYLDALALEGLTIPNITATTWTLVSGTGSYLIGSGQTVNVARPVASGVIDSLSYTDASVTPVYERLIPLLTDGAYERIAQKALTSTYPIAAYYNPTYSSLAGTLTFWPVPTSTTLTGTLYAPAPLSQMVLSTVVQLPPGYPRMLRDTLAVEIAPDFDAQIPGSLARSAAESMANIKRANSKLIDVPTDAGALGGGRGLSRADFWAGNL